MGAAGITCSSAEMASNGGLGISIDLDLVPSREQNMTAYQYLLSESQERMLLVVKKDKLNDLINEFKKWGLYACVIGNIIKEKEVIISHNKKVVAKIPTSALSDKTPVNFHEVVKEIPNYLLNKWKWSESELPKDKKNNIYSLKFKKDFSWSEIILFLLSNPSIASKKWVFEQYDYQVQLNTIFKPGESDAAVIRLRDQNNKKNKVDYKYSGIAASVDCNNRWVSLDPLRGSIAAVAESARNVSCVGALPVAITNNLNFASPETEIGYWQLSNACDGISLACKALETPVTGGNVSLYNESIDDEGKKKPIHPTPVIGMVGILDDVKKAISSGWKNINDEIWIIGSRSSDITLGASSYLEYFHGEVTGRPPSLNLVDEKLCQSFIRNGILNNLIISCHDISDGGLAIALAEACIVSEKGASINLIGDERKDNLLFSEGGSRIIFSIPHIRKNEWLKFVSQESKNFTDSIYVTKIGLVSQDILKIKFLDNILCDLKISALADKFNNGLSINF